MEWLSEDPHRGQIALSCVALGITTILIWLLRKRIMIAIPCAFTFLLLAIVAIPSIIPARNVAYRNACINNLKQIANAKNQWAREKYKLPTDIPTEQDLCGTNGFLTNMLVCPAHGKYTFSAVNAKPTCSLANKGHSLE
jgi:hypothetical protein